MLDNFWTSSKANLNSLSLGSTSDASQRVLQNEKRERSISTASQYWGSEISFLTGSSVSSELQCADQRVKYDPDIKNVRDVPTVVEFELLDTVEPLRVDWVGGGMASGVVGPVVAWIPSSSTSIGEYWAEVSILWRRRSGLRLVKCETAPERFKLRN